MIEFLEINVGNKPVQDVYDSGFICSNCGSFVKKYKRSINSNMAITLLRLYKANERGWVKVEDWLREHGFKRSGDFHKLCLWGLLDKMYAERPDSSERNGYYRLNGKSLMFCEKKLKVAKNVVLLHGIVKGFNGPEVDIEECLNDTFSYAELMI